MSLLVNFDCEAKKKEKGKKKNPEIPDNRLRRDVNLATRGRRECEKRETEPSETKGGVEGEESKGRRWLMNAFQWRRRGR